MTAHYRTVSLCWAEAARIQVQRGQKRETATLRHCETARLAEGVESVKEPERVWEQDARAKARARAEQREEGDEGGEEAGEDNKALRGWLGCVGTNLRRSLITAISVACTVADQLTHALTSF